MKKITMNSFGKGMNMDLNPLSTPKDVLTDCLNGTIVTYNGDEFSLQTELGNVKVLVTSADTSDTDAMPVGFIPLGLKEYNGIIYIVAHNPFTKETRIGSLPSPQRYSTVEDPGNLTIKTLEQIQSESGGLTDPITINHGMNFLTSYIKDTDKYKIAITLGSIDNFSDGEAILSKFINNYDNTGQGYFDFNYSIIDVNGNSTPLEVVLKPSGESSDIHYTPTPFEFSTGENGISKVYKETAKGIVSLSMVPSTIKAFDFELSGNHSDDILKGKITFKKSLVQEDNSAIKINSVLLQTVSSEGTIIVDKYFNYKTFRESEDTFREVYIENLDSGYQPVSFELDTLLTVTATPIDQFGRVLTAFTKVHTYSVSDVPVGTESHNLFTYSIDGDNFTLNYNFLYTGPASTITTTNIEFYDFWSNITMLVSDIALDNYIVSTTIPLYTAEKSTVFDGTTRGGVLTADYTVNTDASLFSDKIMVENKLRKNHAYIIRIFGEENDKSYNIFQLLYTLPIPIFVDTDNTNFGNINIINGIVSNGVYDFAYTGTGIVDPAITSTLVLDPSPILGEDNSCNYAPSSLSHPSFTYEEPYRLYGGPVFHEAYNTSPTTLKTSEWGSGFAYFRNMYNSENFFPSSDANITGVGYHTFGDLSSKLGLVPDGAISSSFFSVGNPYIIGGLTQVGSHKDFKFSLLGNYVSNPANQIGTIQILPQNSSNAPVLFGVVDQTLFSKLLTLKEYQYPNTSNAFERIVTYTSNDIEADYTWFDPLNIPDVVIDSNAEMKAKLVCTMELDTFTLTEMSFTAQRAVTAPSLFEIYNKSYTRDKSFKYFTWFNNQGIKSSRNTIGLADDLSTYNSYQFLGDPDNGISNFVIHVNDTKEIDQFQVLSQFGTDVNFKIKIDSFSYPDVITDTINRIGFIIPGMSTSFSGTFTLEGVSLDSSSYTIGCLTSNLGNTSPQTIYQNYRTSIPIYTKIQNTDYNSNLGTYNNLWLSDFIDANPYISMKTIDGCDYLNNLYAYQNYRETIVAQYPDAANMNYMLESTNTLSLLDNNISYVVNTSITDNTLKYLTKTCWGSSTLLPFTVGKTKTIIDNWITTNVNAKVLYNFVDATKSTGEAKNIGWDFENIQSTTVSIRPIEISLVQASPDVTAIFSNAKTTLDNCSYLESAGAVTPLVHARNGNTIVSTSGDYFSFAPPVSTVSAANNINNQNLKVPVLINSDFSGLILSNNDTITYGITRKILDQPTISNIITGRNISIGDSFGGGIVFYLLQSGDLGYDSNVQHGLISAIADCSPSVWWGSLECSQVSPGAYNNDIGYGKANSDIILANPCQAVHAVSTCYNYAYNEYDDWYMPSIYELVEMRLQKTLIGGFSNTFYWSSSEPNGGGTDWKKSWALDFSGLSAVTTYDKNNAMKVRAIRSF